MAVAFIVRMLTLWNTCIVVQVVEVWYLLAIAQRFAKAEDTIGTLCRAKLLYTLTECTQEVSTRPLHCTSAVSHARCDDACGVHG